MINNKAEITNALFWHECSSDSIDILRASPDIQNVQEKIDDKDYSEIYVTHASDQLISNLKSQFKEKMDSLELDGFYPPMWKINY